MRKNVATSLCLLLGGLLPTGLRAAEVPLDPPTFEAFKTPLPYRANWGPYLVSVDATTADRRIANQLQISERTGHILREVSAYYIEDVDYPDLSGHGGPEQLRVTTAPANNLLSNRRTYCFTALRRSEWVKRTGLMGAVRPQTPHRSPRQAFRGNSERRFLRGGALA